MPAEISMDDIRSLRKRRGMWFPGENLYVVVAAYILGIERAAPHQLEGFEEYVSVTRSKNIVQGWPEGVLAGGGLTPVEIRALMEGEASPEVNDRAITMLFDALDEYANIRLNGSLSSILARFRGMNESG